MDIIQEYSQAGFALIPLTGKDPIEGLCNWPNTPVDPDMRRIDMLGNYGVIAGARLIIDVDCKKGAKGKESFARLTQDAGLEKGWETRTFVVQTGSGGFHIYLSAPDDYAMPKHLTKYPGLEFLHGPTKHHPKGFYVVGPESIHPDTNTAYKVIYGSPKAITAMPESLRDILQVPEIARLGPEPEKGFTDDDPLNIERFKELLRDMPVVSVGNQRNSAYVAACRGRDFGLSLAKCTEVLQKEYNGVKLQPPIREEEIEESARNAYKYARSKAGHLNVSAIFKATNVGEPLNTGALAYDISPKGQPQKTLNNCVNYLTALPPLAEVFRFNAFSQLVEINSTAPWYKERGSKGATVTRT
jgi:hypothetical protein